MKRKRARRPGRPGIEFLEDRRVMATWGIPWPAPQQLTVSFVPDGASCLGQSSDLYASLDSELGPGNWEPTILRAVQTWASTANIDVGLVADGGQPVGAAGAAQGDPRFGDIRISAAPMSSGVLAIGAPYDPTTGTISGDIILNSNVDFKPQDPGAYDLFTVALHEAGHSFGFADSADPSSFMYDVYGGPQTGLLPGASAAMQALYGAPPAAQGNNGTSIQSAIQLQPTPGSNNPAISTYAGALTPSMGVAYLRYNPAGSANYSSGLDVQVKTAGISLLDPTVTVLDASGNTVATASASGPIAGGVSVHVASINPKNPYFVRVSGSPDAFGIGNFQVTASPTAGSSSTPGNIGGGQTINPGPNYDGSFPLSAGNVISTSGQADVYNFTTPASTANGLTVTLKAWGVAVAPPTIAVYDPNQNLIAQATASAGTSGTASFHLSGIQPNAKYFVQVSDPAGKAWATGTYRFLLDFRSASAQAAQPADVALTTVSTIPQQQNPANPTPLPIPGNATSFQMISSIAASSYSLYQVAPPKPPGNGQEVVTVNVLDLDGDGFSPRPTILDNKGNLIPCQVLAANNGDTVVQFLAAQSVPNYLILVAGASPAIGGNFFLGLTFGSPAASAQTVASGTVGAASGSAPPASITLGGDQLEQFILSAGPGQTGAAVQMVITDAAGDVVAILTAAQGQSSSIALLLPPGTYTASFSEIPPVGGQSTPLTYVLTAIDETDPIKAYPYSGGGSTGTGN